MKLKIIESCLKAEDIEKFVLTRKDCNLQKGLLILHHFNCCDKCSQHFFESEMFHSILDDELNKPVSQRVITLAEGLSRNLFVVNEN